MADSAPACSTAFRLMSILGRAAGRHLASTRHEAPASNLRRTSLAGLIWSLLLGAWWLTVPFVQAATDFLPPEQAFRVQAHRIAEDRAEVTVQIAPGYYVYREPLRFDATGQVLKAVEIPAGKVKFDDNFQKNVETYRGSLTVGLPLAAGTTAFRLTVTVQGCADAGLCYPPMTVESDITATPTSAASGGTGASAASPPTGEVPLGASRGLLESMRAGSLVDDVLQSGKAWRVVGVFFVLGLLLSFTPCVLPMLPILSSLIVGTQQRANRMRGAWLAACYTLGMALVYTALGVAAGLAGEGLAGALQTPWMIAGFAGLLVLFSLSMFDVYELRLPQRFTQQVTDQCQRLPTGQALGVFLMGGLSALMVSPCVTAPLGGALLFISQSRDVVMGGSALFAMACGMGVPLLMLGATSGRWLPRSGPWMVVVKRLFGLLMLGVALWVAAPVLPQWSTMLAWGLLLVVLGLQLKPLQRLPSHHHPVRRLAHRAGGIVAVAFGLMQVVGAATGGNDPLRPLAHLREADAARVRPPEFQVIHSEVQLEAALRAAGGRPVVLDFYADWCVSCKEMERFTLRHPEVSARLQGAVLLKADVTANRPDERALLRRFKLFGPPGMLFFDPQGQELADARVVGFLPPRRFLLTLDQVGL